MSTLSHPAPPAASRTSHGVEVVRRLWRLPVAAHLLALGLVLVALLPVVGTQASFSADEGAAIAQARSLARGGGWIVEHPLPEADPAGDHYPLELSARGPKGVAPFAKHPLYALLLAGADRLGGITAMVLLSLAGTLAAAAVAAALAGRVAPSLARPALWATGVASPLLFDGYLVIAHTLGAAAASAAVLAAIVALERRSRTALLVVGACLIVAVLLRSEATLLGLGLAVAAGLVALVDRERRGPAVAVCGVALACSLAARGLEQAWVASIVGGSPATTGGGAGGGSGLVADRVHALVLTWLRPGYGGSVLTEAALIVMLVALALGARVARRHPRDGTAIGFLSALAALCSWVALAVSPAHVVPGLLVAFPLATAGLAAMGRDALGTLASRLAGATFFLFAVAVAATQYATGGSGEWGGRYFALGLPLLVPVVLAALQKAASALDAVTLRRAGAALVVCSLALATMGIASLRSSHRFTDRLMKAVELAARSTGPEGRPVVIATHPALPRLAWPISTRQRWLRSETAAVGDLAVRLRRLGERRVVVTGRGRPPETVPGTDVVAADGWASDAGWFVVVVDLEG